MLRVLSLFSGIGAFEIALNEENVEWELDHYCEIDKFACQSYNCIHGTTDKDNLKDVTNIDYSKIGHIDLVTYGFPCQDISLAGNQKGFYDEEGNLTRSGLFFNAADIIRHTKPKFAIFENVKNLTGKKFKKEFETVLSTLDELGYNTYWKVLNAKDYGIPQNRERVFGISIRKDIDHGYDFPLPVELTLRLKDMLEEHVEEKYYLSEQCLKGFLKHNENHEVKGTGFKWKPRELNGIASCLRANSALAPTDNTIVEPRIEQVGNIDLGNNESNNRVYSPDGLSSTLNTMQGGHRQPKIIEPCIVQKPHGYNKGGLKELAPSLTISSYEQNNYIIEPMICASRGRNPENPSSRKAGEHTEQRLEVNTSGCSNTLTTIQKDDYVLEPLLYPCMNKQGYKLAYDGDGIVTSRPHQARSTVMPSCSFAIRAQNAGDSGVCLKEGQEYRIRKLTPRECWRLMGFKDKYFDRVQGVSNSQLYKQAGNSIVVDVLRAIFRELKNQYKL